MNVESLGLPLPDTERQRPDIKRPEAEKKPEMDDKQLLEMMETGEVYVIPKEVVEGETHKGFVEKAPARTVEIKVGNELKDSSGETYRLLDKLGEGGMGSVFKVEDSRGFVRAIKFMNSSQRADPLAMRRFKREVTVMSQLQNPFIVPPHDVTTFEIDGEEVVGLVMAYEEGPTLSEVFEKEKPIDPFEIAVYSGEILYGLEALRRAGIVHRDIKPKNIFLTKEVKGQRFVRIGDFGIAGFAFQDERPRAMDQDASWLKDKDANTHATIQGRITEQGTVTGTVPYMSPEAASGKLVDHRSDLYSFGVLLYELITKKVPFEGMAPEVMIAHIRDKVPTFEEQEVKDVPKWLESIVFKLLEKKPEKRFQSAGEVYQAFQEAIEKERPELLNQVPFQWDITTKSAYERTRLQRAA